MVSQWQQFVICFNILTQCPNTLIVDLIKTKLSGWVAKVIFVVVANKLVKNSKVNYVVATQ
jgi:hypothetical protein